MTAGHAMAALPGQGFGNGRLDLLLGGQDTGPVRTSWRGGTLEEDEHAVLLRLEARSINRDALGCRVELTAGGRRQVRVVGLAPGMPGPPGVVHFGVGSALRVEQVTVRWPDGRVESQEDLPVDRLIRLRQGRAPLWSDPDDEDDGPPPRDPPPTPAPPPASQPTPLLSPLKLTVKTPGGARPLSALIRGERATLVLFTVGGLRSSGRCRKLWALRRHKGVGLAEVRLSGGPGRRRCGLPSYRATPSTIAALKDRRGLLPLLVVIGPDGQVFRLVSEPDPPQVEASLLEALSRSKKD